ncbi:DgyrCDS14622 [Dimorphilus gyrociliatus]|uniref:DgyrCDS14622 n=1 Tax=Dimorphilus gyrociliatus TaxID=2664684 RepID=A0A7I8WE93_9ANNE|nr:DgyrCDS14622 [Dimorphilus gyrociliatus]
MTVEEEFNGVCIIKTASGVGSVAVEIDLSTPIPQLTTKTLKTRETSPKTATLFVNNKPVSCDNRTTQKVELDCNGKSYNIISSNPYLPNSDCLIHLIPPQGRKGTIYFKFKYFDIERHYACKFDYVEIIDDRGQSFKFCEDPIVGNKGNISLRMKPYSHEVDINKTYFISMKNSFKLIFKSDRYTQKTGFHLTTTLSCLPKTLPVRQVLCNWDNHDINIHCDMGDLRIISPISKTKNMEVEFEFLSFNLQRNTGMSYHVLTFSQNFRYIKYSGKANKVGSETNRISIFEGQYLKPPKLGTTYYINETGDLNINYFEGTDMGGSSFEMIARAKCIS